MKKSLYILFLFYNLLFGNDYEFSFDELEEIELKSYEYSAYLKTEHKYQILNKSSPKYPSKNKNSMETYKTQGYLNLKYFKDDFTLNTDFIVSYENIDKEEQDDFTANQLFLNYNYDDNHQLTLGKNTPKWGKGYYFNPIAFIDRKKDPVDPEANREGFTSINYKYNKALNSSLQNISFDLFYFKTTKEFNEELYSEDSNILAFKTYLLYKDIDIDLAYYYNDKTSNKFGIDLSTNIQTNFEIHAEFAKADNREYSYLLGLKYLTNNELTILSEYYYQNKEQSKVSSFWDNRYFINKFTQKEPLDILYLNLYYKNTLNIDDHSYQNRLGIIYTGIKNLNIDFSISKHKGKLTSEFGSKLVDSLTWLSLKYSF